MSRRDASPSVPHRAHLLAGACWASLAILLLIWGLAWPFSGELTWGGLLFLPLGGLWFVDSLGFVCAWWIERYGMLSVWGLVGLSLGGAFIGMVAAGSLADLVRPFVWTFRLREALRSAPAGGGPPMSVEDVAAVELWYDQVGYLVEARPASSRGGRTALDLAGVWWSDDRTHVVERREATVLPMSTCDHAVAYPLCGSWWYVTLNK